MLTVALQTTYAVKTDDYAQCISVCSFIGSVWRSGSKAYPKAATWHSNRAGVSRLQRQIPDVVLMQVSPRSRANRKTSGIEHLNMASRNCEFRPQCTERWKKGCRREDWLNGVHRSRLTRQKKHRVSFYTASESLGSNVLPQKIS